MIQNIFTFNKLQTNFLLQDCNILLVFSEILVSTKNLEIKIIVLDLVNQIINTRTEFIIGHAILGTMLQINDKNTDILKLIIKSLGAFVELSGKFAISIFQY